MSATFTIEPQGPFALRESATFGFGQRASTPWDGVMRLAFCVDGYTEQAGVELRQDDAGVHGSVWGDADPDAVRAQVARVLSLDVDAHDYPAIGRRDPVVGRLMAATPGLRPPLFYSPYEGAAWAVLSARRPAEQMAVVRQRLCEEHGATFELAGERLAAFPTPERLLEVDAADGVPAEKLSRLHGVARAAVEGRLDIGRLRGMEPAEAMADVRSIKGIGPFYSALIVIRGTGCADVLPVDEPRLLAEVARRYDLPAPASAAQLESLAQAWRPFRTWVAVLIRASAEDSATQPSPGGRRRG